ncbi:membrane protein [Rhodococcus erythropolis]|nr:membrane protein [Rhodococcus erythropolis]
MVIFFDILLVLCVVAIVCFAGYVLYRVVFDG